MIRPIRAARVVCTVLVEGGVLLVLLALGRRPELAVPAGHVGQWLRDGDAATVVVALTRWAAVLGAGWLLGSTLLYVVASLTRVPAAVRAVRWSTLPAVRRAVDAACVVSIATSVVLAPAAAGAARATDPPSVSLVRDGHAGGDLSGLPADTATTTTTTRSVAPATAPVAPATTAVPLEPVASPAEVVVVEGDNLWVLSARHLASTTGRALLDVPVGEVAPYWFRVCETNRARLVSGDPNLVLPGERVILPPTG